MESQTQPYSPMRDFCAKLSNRAKQPENAGVHASSFRPSLVRFVYTVAATFAAIRGTFARCLQRRRYIIEEHDARPVTVSPKKRAMLCATFAKVTIGSCSATSWQSASATTSEGPCFDPERAPMRRWIGLLLVVPRRCAETSHSSAPSEAGVRPPALKTLR